MALDPRLTAYLVCPICKGTLVADQEKHTLNCPRCRLAFAVTDNIPNMLPGDAAKLSQEQAKAYNARLSKVCGE